MLVREVGDPAALQGIQTDKFRVLHTKVMPFGIGTFHQVTLSAYHSHCIAIALHCNSTALQLHCIAIAHHYSDVLSVM